MEEDKCYSLEETVNVWGDYLRVHLHPRSVLLLNDYHLNDPTEPFSLSTTGISAWKSLEDDMEQALRLYAEECDLMQVGCVIDQ